MKKKINERCPLQSECEYTCKYELREAECDYYRANARPGVEIEGIELASGLNLLTEDVEQVFSQGELVYIDIDKLYPHPDNPRKDLGDITELAESIRQKGVLQNLTVVPGHEITADEYAELCTKYRENPTEELREEMNTKPRRDDGYTLVIGHRRCSAAREAGLKELPCIISNMDEHEQFRTMMIENMNRSDLTVYEQAEGFQMMLDFGDSMSDIADKTGFSTSTVRRRVNLLSLDKDKFKKAEKRGATLMDYMKLEEIKDVDLKNEVLQSLGTANFESHFKRAMDKEEVQGSLARVLAVLETFAERIEESNREEMRYIRNYSRWNISNEIDVPEDANTSTYFYRVYDAQIDLFRSKADDVVDPEEEKRKAMEAEKEAKFSALQDDFDAMTKRHAELRSDFVKSYSFTDARRNLGAIVFGLLRAGEFDFKMVKIEELATKEDVQGNEDECVTQVIRDMCIAQPASRLLNIAHMMLESTNYMQRDKGYYDKVWIHGKRMYRLQHCENKRLDYCYEMLTALGYELSDEEIAMKDGTHELFGKMAELEEEYANDESVEN